MIDAGNGSSTASFGDINQGKPFTRKVRADVYYSWFAPDGPASDSTNAGNVKKGTAVLWVSGDKDRVSEYGQRLVWNRVPDDSRNKFEVISSDHRNTPNDSAKIVADWLRSLN